MKNTFFVIAAIFVLLLSSPHPANAGDLEVSGAFARASAGPARNGAVFFTVKNHGKKADVLISAATDVAKKAQLHGHTMKDGMMNMSQVKSGIPVPPGGMAMLKPGGQHVMLMGLKAPLKVGEKLSLVLTFKNGDNMTVDIPILGVGAKSAMGQKGMSQGHLRHK